MNLDNMIQGNPQALVKSVNGIMVPVCITPIGKPQRVSGTVVTFYNLLITLKEIC